MFWLASSVALLFLALGIAAAGPLKPGSERRIAPTTPPSSPTPVRVLPYRDDAANLLANSSFEMDADANGIADGWGGDSLSAKYSLVGEARFGSFSQQMMKESHADPIAHFSALQQRVRGIVGGRRYEVGIDYRYTFASSPDASRSIGIVVYSLDDAGGFIDAGTSIDWGWPATTTWSRRGLTFRAPTNAVSLIIEFRLSVNGSAWLDGASLRAIGS